MFGDDPFRMFEHVHNQMHHMDRMMESMMMDPFGFGRPPMMGMVEGPPRRRRPMSEERMALGMPYGPGPMGPMMMSPFGHIGGIFSAMNNLQERAMHDPDSHVYMQSTMMTFDDQGRPRVVQKSTRKAGDVREDRRRVQDADIEEMEIGHTIGDRTHVMEKKRDKDGIIRNQQRFHNLDEADAASFDREFQSRARSNIFGGRSSSSRTALEGGPSMPSSSSSRYSRPQPRDNGPIITLPEEEEQPRQDRDSRYRSGPIIREISDEEAESSIPKRRRGF